MAGLIMTGFRSLRPYFVLNNIDLLAGLRNYKHMTRPELSKKTGISLAMLENYELGYQMPTKENYNKLAEIFGWQKWEA